jgi:hypothetical protein
LILILEKELRFLKLKVREVLKVFLENVENQDLKVQEDR